MNFQIVRTVTLPRERLFAGLLDLDAAHYWMPGLVRLERQGEAGPLRESSVWRETRMMFGKEATEEFEVTHLQAPERLSLRVDGSKGASKRGEYLFDYHLQERDGGTHLVVDCRMEGMGVMGALFGKLLGGMFRKAMEKDLDALLHYLAKPEPETGGGISA